MTTYNTGNPIGSTDSRDRLDNTENMDYLENSTTELTHPDRLGTVRKTRHGMEAEHDNQIAAHEVEHDNQMQSFETDFDGRLAGMAFTRVGTFTAGATLTDMRQTLLWEVSQGGDGHEYGWTGSFLPSGKVVAAGSTPATSGGVGAGSWVDRTDDALRSDLNVVVKVFESVSDMDADASLVVGQKCRTLGYYAVGDGGGNDYIIVAAATGTDDGGSYIDLSGTGFQAKVLFGSVVNVKNFGAKGDGITDDTNAIKKALMMQGRIFVPSGNYLITDTVNISNFVELFGEGSDNTTFTSSANNTAFTVDPGAHLSLSVIKLTSNVTTLDATGCTSLSIKKATITGDTAVIVNYDSSNQLTDLTVSDGCKVNGKVIFRIDSLGNDINGRWDISGTEFDLGELDNRSGIIFTCRENGVDPVGDFYGFRMSNCQVTCDGVSGTGQDIINMGGRFKTPIFEQLLIKNTVESDTVELDLFDGGDDFTVRQCTFVDVALKCFGSTSNPERAYSLIQDNTFRLGPTNPNLYCIIRRFSFLTISENTFVCKNALNAPIFLQADSDAFICEYIHIKENTAILSNQTPFIMANGLRYSRITGNISPNSPIIVNQGTRVVEKNIITGNVFAETSSPTNALIPVGNIFDDNIAENAIVTGLRQTKKLSAISVRDTGSSTVSVYDVGYYIRPLSDLDTVTDGLNGDLLTLQFGGTAGIVITHTAGFAGGGKFKLDGGVNFTSSGNDWITFRYIRGFWVEQSRGVIS